METTAASRGEEVRGRLRRAAVALIAERGWRAVTTRQVAERAGVGAGLVHYHFASVEALLRDAALEVMREVVAEVDGLLDAADDAETGMGLVLEALDAHSGQDTTSLLFLEAYLAAARDDGLRAEVAAVLHGVRRSIASWLDRCGVPDPGPTAAVLAAAVDGLLLHRGLDPALTSGVAGSVLGRVLDRGEEA